MDLSPEGQKAVYFGSYYFYRDVLVTGSAILGAFLWKSFSPAATFLTSAIFGIAGLLVFILKGKDSDF